MHEKKGIPKQYRNDRYFGKSFRKIDYILEKKNRFILSVIKIFTMG